ncbi:hypothetical protein [Rhodoferax aquaticus]|uniref:Uncharacterized protein n=1 Tax=Rhodoferax aquaticus TaxID=2527691 RepID=A0A515EUY4_9BURK|nr:hypothetical protein [Rhodoferax aquaticus]QDL56492.1 hypothetical protein EXZ61_21325 [Rhodoferax aquaticus]
MAKLPIRILGCLSALLPVCAWASTVAGTTTLYWGLPGLLLANGLALWLRTMRPTRLRQTTIKLVYYPALFVAALVALDAVASAVSRGWYGLLVGALYFALFAGLLYLLRQLLSAELVTDASSTP